MDPLERLRRELWEQYYGTMRARLYGIPDVYRVALLGVAHFRSLEK